MNEVSKLLIAYYGSACSDAALNDLRRAGLRAAVEAVVVTAVDMILPPPDDELPDDDVAAIRIPEVERRAWPQGSEVRVITAGDALRPEMYGVQTEKMRAAGLRTSEVIREGDPAHALIREAEE